MRALRLACLALVATVASCGPGASSPGPPPVVVFLGDSLTAGPGLRPEQTYPALLAARFAAAGRPIQAINAGISGEESGDGLARLAPLLEQRPDVVVVALGANDGLGGRPPADTEANLRQVIERSRQAGASVLLLGMRLPGIGRDVEAFEAIYPRLADELDVELMPFMLKGVAGRPGLNLEDRIHPNAKGHETMAETIEPYLRRVLRRRR